MFFNNRQKDEEIARLKKRVEELENQKSDENILLEELNEVLLKFEKAFLE